MIDMDQFQKEINKLQIHFERKAKELDKKELIMIKCALGMNEEAGELAHVVLKGITGHYGFDDKEQIKEKAIDAIIDAFVFGLQILNELDTKFEDVFPKILEEVIERNKKNKSHTPIQMNGGHKQ